MAFWNRGWSLEDRFPPDRLAVVPIVVIGAAATATSKHGIDRMAILDTKFFVGYLAGFTDYLDDIDHRLGGMIRKLTFDQIWGAEKGQLRFAQAVVLLNDQDQQAKRGFGFAVPDGERYFKALEGDVPLRTS